VKFKIGDSVIVTAGKDKSKVGKIERVYPKLYKVLVAGVNIYKRHKKSTGKTLQGGIIDITKPLPVANVALVCPKCNLPTRVGYRIEGKEKLRVCKKCKQAI